MLKRLFLLLTVCVSALGLQVAQAAVCANNNSWAGHLAHGTTDATWMSLGNTSTYSGSGTMAFLWSTGTSLADRWKSTDGPAVMYISGYTAANGVQPTFTIDGTSAGGTTAATEATGNYGPYGRSWQINGDSTWNGGAITTGVTMTWPAGTTMTPGVYSVTVSLKCPGTGANSGSSVTLTQTTSMTLTTTCTIVATNGGTLEPTNGNKSITNWNSPGTALVDYIGSPTVSVAQTAVTQTPSGMPSWTTSAVQLSDSAGVGTWSMAAPTASGTLNSGSKTSINIKATVNFDATLKPGTYTISNTLTCQ